MPSAIRFSSMPLRAFLALLLATAASAQPRGIDPPVLVVGGLVGGIATAGAAAALVPGDGGAEAETIAILVGYPLGVAAGMAATGQLLGHDRSLAGAVRDALVGSAIGLGVGGAVYLVGRAVTPASDDFFDGLGVALLAAGTYAVVPLAAVLHGFEVAPAPLAGPGGERSLGLMLSVDL